MMGMLTGSDKVFRYDQAGRLIYESKTSRYYGELDTTENIVFLYDESGMIGMQCTGSSAAGTYYFRRNLLGDVVAIYNTASTKVAGYAYDAWGNCTVTLNTNGIATKNPIRYRGYYYDEETGLYYLNARYYSPEWRRFISPDDTAYLDPETPNGLNLYTYCGNDPVNYADPSGCAPEWWQWVLSGATLAAGIACCFIPGGQVFGVGLIVAGTSGLVANTLDAVGLDGKYASIIMSGLSILAGTVLCFFPPFVGIGVGLIGQGIGGIAGGYIAEVLGGSFEAGAAIGGIAGSIIASGIYNGIKYLATANVHNPIGTPFNPRSSTQIGVDPYSLKISRTLNPEKLSVVKTRIIKTGMYGVIEVMRDGTIIDGNHRVAVARLLRIAVDVYIR